MKKTILIILIGFITLNAFSQQTKKSKTETKQTAQEIKKQSTILFKSTVYDFGKLKEEEDAIAEFTFKNISKNPVVITSVEPSCGCTLADWTKEAVAKKAKGKILVTYDTKNIGKFQKTINVELQNNEIIILEIKGEVVK